MNSKRNKIIWGLLAGIFVPLIVSYLYYRINFIDFGFVKFIEYVVNLNVYTHLISLCVLPKILVFFIAIWTNLMKSAKGVLVATFVYAFVLLGLKLFA